MIKNTQIRIATEEGISKGISQGISQGIDAWKRELINEMLKNGITIEQISKMINMSIDDINKIIN